MVVFWIICLCLNQREISPGKAAVAFGSVEKLGIPLDNSEIGKFHESLRTYVGIYPNYSKE